MSNVNINWGDIVFCDFGDGCGSEQKGIRPALVIQNDKGNQCSSTVIVACITSADKRYLPTHVIVSPEQSGLKKDSTIMFEQIRTIDKSRIISKVGKVNADELIKKVKKALTISLNIAIL